MTHAVVTVGPAPQLDFPDYTARAPLPDRDEFDWDLWLGPAAVAAVSRPTGLPAGSGYRDFGLASIGNWGSHVLDMAQWALGKDAEGPVEILPPERRHAADAQIRRRRGDPLPAHAGRFGQLRGLRHRRAEDHLRRARRSRRSSIRTPLGPGDVRLYRPRNNDHNGNWLECIRTRKKTICNEEVGYRSGSLCQLIAIMDRLKRPLKYDPVKAEFPGDDEANRLLDTPKRSPWQIH